MKKKCIIPKAIIITPTIGTHYLEKAINSVQEQIFEDILHLIVIDGESYKDKVYEITEKFPPERLKVLLLPFNTGANGYNGHKIYATIPFVINCSYVFFLDEDNWYDSNHVSSLIELIEQDNLDWAYSLRKICKSNAEFITNDDCESLGRWPPWLLPEHPPHSDYPNLVDTNCYAIKRDVLVKVAHYWNHPLGADRIFLRNTSNHFPFFTSSSLYTVNYRLNETKSIAHHYVDYFKLGNRFMFEQYGENPPWRHM